MDAAALQELYELYGYAVHRRCLWLLREPAQADDALQEVFLKVLRYGQSFRGENPLGWLYRIADRHCFNMIRKRENRTRFDILEQTAESEQKMGEATSRAYLARLVAQVLAECPRRVGEVAVLYYVDGMTQDEVSRAVGCSRKTIKKRLARFQKIAGDLLNLS